MSKNENLRPNRDLLHGQSVLLIEDDEVNQILLNRMITDQGGHAYLATEKGDALEQARELRPDLVIVDISVKGINSFEYIRSLKALLPGGSLIMGITSVNYRGRGLLYGLDGMMHKPIDYSSFKESLSQLFA